MGVTGAVTPGKMLKIRSLDPCKTSRTRSPGGNMFPSIRVISRDNGVGLTRDLALMARTLSTAGFPVQRVGFKKGGMQTRLREGGLWVSRALRGRVPLQIFSERVYPRCLPLGQCNVLVPNPEWMLPKWLSYLPDFDRVLCKTRHAERIFRDLGCRTSLVGFTSEDRYDPQVPRQRAFFHLAGRSSAKGTRVLLDAWSQHPQWPLLTVVQNPRTAGVQVRAANIDHRIDYIDEGELRRLQNAHAFHICPSEAEGFGHYLMEAMSVGAVTLTTDGEPMNELVSAQRGILIPPSITQRRRLVSYYHVDVAGIEQAVATALALPDEHLQQIGMQARDYYRNNHEAFVARFRGAVLPLLTGFQAVAEPAA